MSGLRRRDLVALAFANVARRRYGGRWVPIPPDDQDAPVASARPDDDPLDRSRDDRDDPDVVGEPGGGTTGACTATP